MSSMQAGLDSLLQSGEHVVFRGERRSSRVALVIISAFLIVGGGTWIAGELRLASLPFSIVVGAVPAVFLFILLPRAEIILTESRLLMRRGRTVLHSTVVSLTDIERFDVVSFESVLRCRDGQVVSLALMPAMSRLVEAMATKTDTGLPDGIPPNLARWWMSLDAVRIVAGVAACALLLRWLQALAGISLAFDLQSLAMVLVALPLLLAGILLGWMIGIAASAALMRLFLRPEDARLIFDEVNRKSILSEPNRPKALSWMAWPLRAGRGFASLLYGETI